MKEKADYCGVCNRIFDSCLEEGVTNNSGNP